MQSHLRYPVIVFDLDGTLVDSLGIKVKNAGKVWHAFYSINPKTTENTYRKYSGIPRQQLFKKMAMDFLNRNISQEEYNALSENFTKLNIASLKKKSFSKETDLFLHKLKDSGAILAVSSSAAEEEVQKRLHNKRSLFTFILGSKEGFFKGKSHLEFIAKKTKQPLKNILFIGDESADLYLAREAGVKIALIANTYPSEKLQKLQPDILISKFSDLWSCTFKK